MESKGQCSKGDACSFRHDDSRRGKKTQSSSLAQGRRHKMTEENFRKGSLPEAVVFLGGEIKKRADITKEETVRIRHVTSGILPFVKITNLDRDANSAGRAYSSTKRLTVSPTTSRRKVVEKDLLLQLKNSKQLRCVFQDEEPPKSKSSLRKSTESLGPKRSLRF